jgi:hypothetical protein
MRYPKFRSRIGNLALAAAGVLYIVSALGLLGWYVVTTWPDAHLLDRLLQFALLGAALVGLLFVVVAAPRLIRRSARADRTAAEAQS